MQSKRIVEAQCASFFTRRDDNGYVLGDFFRPSLNLNPNPRDHYIRNDCKLPSESESESTELELEGIVEEENHRLKAFSSSSFSSSFREVIMPHINMNSIDLLKKKDRDKKFCLKHSSSVGVPVGGWKESIAKNDVHSFFTSKQLRGEKNRRFQLRLKSSTRQFNNGVTVMIEKTPSQIILNDPRLPYKSNGDDRMVSITTTANEPCSFMCPSESEPSLNMIMSLAVFNQLPRRSLTPNHKSLSSSIDVFRYRTLGTIMAPYNLTGGVHIQHENHQKLHHNDRHLSSTTINDDLFQREHSFVSSLVAGLGTSKSVERSQSQNECGDGRMSAKSQSLSSLMKTKRNPTLCLRSESRSRNKNISNTNEAFSISNFVGKNYIHIGSDKRGNGYNGEQRATFSSLAESFEAVQSISVEVRGEFLHLLSKSQELESNTGEDTGAEMKLKSSEQIDQNNVATEELALVSNDGGGHNTTQGQNRKEKSKYERIFSQDLKREHKKRKRKNKDKKKKRSSKKKRKKENESKQQEVEIIKVPSLHVGSTPMVITHAKYEVTSVHNTSGNGCHQQIYRSDVEVKNVMGDLQQQRGHSEENIVPRTAVPSFPLGMTPVAVSTRAIRASNYNNTENGVQMMGEEATQDSRTALNNQVAQTSGQFDSNSRQMYNCEHSMSLPDGITPLVKRTKTHHHQPMPTFENNHLLSTQEDTHDFSCNAPSNIEGPSVFPYNDINNNNNNNSTEMCSTNNIACHEQAAQDAGNLYMVPDEDEELLSILCSEHFLENWSQAAAELSSGRWAHHITSQEETNQDNYYTALINKKIILRDCALVDTCYVDVEIPKKSAIKIISLASWSNQTPNQTYNNNNIKSNPKTVIKDLIQLATYRYDTIHLLFVLDSVELSHHLADIANLQNAIVKQNGCPCDYLCTQYVLPNMLSTTIATIVSDCRQNPLGNIKFESELLERAHFLLSLIPTLTALDSILLLHQDISMSFKSQIHSLCNLQSTNMDQKSAQQLALALAAVVRNYPLS